MFANHELANGLMKTQESIYMTGVYSISTLNRFVSADVIVPDSVNPQQFNRYAYSLNNPVKFRDPSGHCAEHGDEACWSVAEQLWQLYDIDLEFLGLLEYDHLTFLQDTFGDLDAYQRDYIVATIQQTLDDDFAREQIFDRGRWDVFGVRTGIGYSVGGGLEGTLDFIWNFNNLEFSVMFNFNGTLGPDGGASGYFGVFLGFNTPDNSVYTGWGTGCSGTATVFGGVAVQHDFSGKILGLNDEWRVKGQSIAAHHGRDPYNVALMVAPGIKAGVSYSVGYTWEIYSYSK